MLRAVRHAQVALVGLALVATAVAADLPCPNPKRSQAVVAEFKKEFPCPRSCALYVRDGSRFVLYEKCGACEADHRCPLACCGADTVDNLQWLTAKENRTKGADCTACSPKP